MIYRVTFGFRGNGQGWSESHACKNASESPQALSATALFIAQKRAAFLGREYEINVIRISRYSNDDATARARGTFLVKQIIKNPIQTVAQAAEPAVVALIGRGTTAAGIAPPAFVANQNRTFLGAPPDDAVTNGGVVDPGKSGLGANFAQWADALINASYGWLLSATIADVNIGTISQEPNGTVSITTANLGEAPLVVGQTYPARARRVNAGVSPLNGQLLVRYLGGNEFVTQQVIGLALAQEGGSLRVYQRVQPFAQFATMTLELETGKHQRGRPFGSTPGRARRRIRG